MKNEKEKVIEWIKKYFEENGKNCKAVVGISGGTDSSVVTALCVAALGRENVIGVLMPKGVQHDIDYSKKLVEFLKIKHYEVNVEKPVNDLKKLISQQMGVNPDEFDTYKTNQPARIRMAVLYGISAIIGGGGANTCNLSEGFVGDLDFTKTEVRKLGAELGLPETFLKKVPEDGMSGKSDEEKLGFSYEVLDEYIRTGNILDLKIKEKIDYLHKINLHKILPMPSYKKGEK